MLNEPYDALKNFIFLTKLFHFQWLVVSINCGQWHASQPIFMVLYFMKHLEQENVLYHFPCFILVAKIAF